MHRIFAEGIFYAERNQFITDASHELKTPLTVDGSAYAGILTIPSLGLELPVCARLDMDAMQSAPCLYSGSLYRKDMVIGAHNYDAHFGRIGSLTPGDSVIFTDAEIHCRKRAAAAGDVCVSE